MVSPKMERFLEQKHFKHDNTPKEVTGEGEISLPLVVVQCSHTKHRVQHSILKMNKMSISKIFDEL